MIEKVLNFFKSLVKVSVKGTIAEMSLLQLMVVFVGCVLFFLLAKLAVKYLKKLFRFLLKKRSHGYRAKCEKITCKYCGRKLKDCICQKNKGLSDYKKYKLYRTELKDEAKKKSVGATPNKTESLKFTRKR